MIDTVVSDHRFVFAATGDTDKWTTRGHVEGVFIRSGRGAGQARNDSRGRSQNLLSLLKLAVGRRRNRIAGIDNQALHEIAQFGRSWADQVPLSGASQG